MEFRESKYLIFDSPKKLSVKFMVKWLLAKVMSPFYKFLYWWTAPKIEQKKYMVSVCAIFRDEGAYIKEWLEYHLLIGVEHFYLYNNFSKDNYREILAPYIENGQVTLIDWPIPQGQMAAFANCVEKFGSETNWIGFIDLDEYVVPNHDDNIKDFLAKFMNRPLVLIYWLYFTSSGHLERNKERLLTEDFTVCWKKYADIGKLFFNTAYDYADDLPRNKYMHHRWGRIGRYVLPPVNVFDNVCIWGENPVPSDDMPAQINHYVIKSYQEYEEKKKRGGGVHKDMHDEYYFWEHELRSSKTDFHIFKYLIMLKQSLQKKNGRENN